MWWAETARLYLGRSMVLVQVGRRGVEAIAPAPTLAQTLRDIDQLVPRSAILDVQWGAAYAPLLEVSYPAGIRRWRDRQTFACAVCARQMGVQPDALALEFDATSPQLVAVLFEEHRAALGVLGRRRIRSARPLWALLTHARLFRSARGLCLHEPDSLTVLGEDGHQHMRGGSMPVTDDAEMVASTASLRQALSLSDTDVTTVRLHAGMQAHPPAGLPWWRDRWSLA